jgi:hypothetical protein
LGVTCQAGGVETQFICQVNRFENVGAIAAGCDGDKEITFFANGTQLARENLIIAIAIANRTHGRGVGSLRKRRQWCPVKLFNQT